MNILYYTRLILSRQTMVPSFLGYITPNRLVGFPVTRTLSSSTRADRASRILYVREIDREKKNLFLTEFKSEEYRPKIISVICRIEISFTCVCFYNKLLINVIMIDMNERRGRKRKKRTLSIGPSRESFLEDLVLFQINHQMSIILVKKDLLRGVEIINLFYVIVCVRVPDTYIIVIVIIIFIFD